MTGNERLIRRISRALVWNNAKPWERGTARNQAIAIVNDLLGAAADGKAVERSLKVVNERLERGT